VGVFTHEYAHDMGIPDLYDYYGENGTGFWTLMSSGSWLDEGKDSIGNKPGHMGVWEKFQLGWANYEVARAGQKSQHNLGPMEFNTKQAQGVFVILPQKPVTAHIADPFEGSYLLLQRLRERPAKQDGQGVHARSRFNADRKGQLRHRRRLRLRQCDHLDRRRRHVQTLPTNLSNSTVEANGIEGFSGGWVDLNVDLSAYTGNVMLASRTTAMVASTSTASWSTTSR